MSSILVVEPENRYSERIHAALGADGWTIRVVNEPGQALEAAAADRPSLVIVSAGMPGAEAVAATLSRRAGGPGVLGLLPASAIATGNQVIPADVLLAEPFSDQDLRQAVQRLARPAPQAAPRNVMLTSQDIFGDVLADLEADEAAQAEPVPFSAPAPAAAPAPAPRPAPRLEEDDEVSRRLERTLTGVFGLESPGQRPRPQAPQAPPAAQSVAAAPSSPAIPAAPAAPPRKERFDPGEAEVDALLSKTLSNLDMGTRARPAPRPATPTVVVPTSSAIPSLDETMTRKAPRPQVDHYSALEELARPTRRPEPAPRPVPVPPVTPIVPPAAPIPALPEPVAPEPVQEIPAPPLPEPELVSESPAPLAPEIPEMREPEREMEIEAIPEPPDIPDWPPMPTQPRSVVHDIAATQRIEIPSLSQLKPPSALSLDETLLEGSGERFGQYTLLDKIAAGGMAEVWKARMRGVEGFQKTVAIKKILPHMTDNSEFVTMFIDEAKLAAQLSHPNIVHIYDLGKIGRDYYIAMEYVEGKDLRSLMNAGRRKGVRLPMGLALFIAARLSSALDYAHRKRDFEDREMGLVHRDVSPQNVLLSQEGDVKLCDFGIAKAVSKAGQTQMGALKGKLQYMSPEQAWGRAVDARSDLFSLGAVLFEMLTGEKLFTGDTEISVLEAVRGGQVRSARQIDPSIPVAVDEVLARALAYEPQSRFGSASEMKQRIEAVLHTLGQSPGPTDLAAYVQRVLEEEPESGDWSAPLSQGLAGAPEIGGVAGMVGAPVAPITPIAPVAPIAPVVNTAREPEIFGTFGMSAVSPAAAAVPEVSIATPAPSEIEAE